jgi:hypothetical protein
MTRKPLRLPPQGAIARPQHVGVLVEGGVTSQLRACTPCVRVGGGRWCFTLPVIGRRCLNVPSLGTWKACCSVRFGWPPVSCGISRC